MRAKLFCKLGHLAGKEFYISDEATIGTNDSNRIVLNAATISGNHARIFCDEGGKHYFLEDLGSANGTRLDRIKVTQKEKLGNLHVITFANEHKFIFQVIKSPEEPVTELSKAVDKNTAKTIFDDGEATPTPDLGDEVRNKTLFDDKVIIPPDLKEARGATVFDDQPIKSPQIEKPQENKQPGLTQLAEGSLNFPPIADGAENDQQAISEEIHPVFELFFKSRKKSFELKEGENVVGRSDECDIYLEDRSISQRHAVLRVKSGKVWIKDLQSKNKTFIKRKEVDEEIELEPDSKIRFGGVGAKLVLKKE